MGYCRLLLMCILITLMPPLLAADDDDDATLDPSLQWKLAMSAWNRREYDDAASLMFAYATMNPDAENVPEAWWNTYEVYRASRPNPARKKDTLEKAIAALTRWEKKFAETDKKRVAKALWYHANLLDREALRPQAETLLLDLLEKFPGTGFDASARWTLAEWQREAKRYGEAAMQYAEYRKLVGVNDQSAQAAFREGWCYQALRDIPNMKQAFGVVLYGNYNWGSGTVLSGALDAAQRLKSVGEEEEARSYALKVLEKSRPDTDIARQANIFLGNHSVKKLYLHPYFNYLYTTDTVNLTPLTKLDGRLDLRLLVRTSYTSKNDPFKGDFTFAPRTEVAKAPGEMTMADGEGGKKVYTTVITDPDEKGKIRGDWWYSCTMAAATQPAMDGLTVTRKWEKMGAGWGECTIRLQSSTRWNITIYLPNDKTNVNNLNVQPNEVRDGGKTFVWYASYDLNQGYTIKFPVEIGAATGEFYPKVVLDRNIRAPYGSKNGAGAEAAYETDEFACKLTAADAFPYTIECRGYQGVTLNQITK